MSKLAKVRMYVVPAMLLLCAMPAESAARQGTRESEILISAAASLRDVMTSIGASFKRVNPGIELAFNYGASGQLRIQIENGAPVDVFISAADADMDVLEQKGLIDRSTRSEVEEAHLFLFEIERWGRAFKSWTTL